MPSNQITFDHEYNEFPPVITDHKSTVRLTSYMQNDKPIGGCKQSVAPYGPAVEIQNLGYEVGRGRKAKVILSEINMTVPRGAIYGLLGPSGSGKTTLLKSVVGQLEPNEGTVKVFGLTPNTPGSQIPGSAIGYMPQELAVYEDFTIKETLWYFGRLYRVSKETISERIEFLLNFLDLPRGKQLIVNMSGGQKRRVSLASALVHSPPLLILDEPTVGVDPLLRQSIWQHLVTLTQTENITVIVTTHYIEEARRANIVGLMRRGRLLAESTPEDLMARHQCNSLEDVFLRLCVTDSLRRTQQYAIKAHMNEEPQAVVCHSKKGKQSIADNNDHDLVINNEMVQQNKFKSPSSPTHSGSGCNSADEGIAPSSASGSIQSSSPPGEQAKVICLSEQNSIEQQQQQQQHDQHHHNIKQSAHDNNDEPLKDIPYCNPTEASNGEPDDNNKFKKKKLRNIFKSKTINQLTTKPVNNGTDKKRRMSGSNYLQQLAYQQQQLVAAAIGQSQKNHILKIDTNQLKNAWHECAHQNRVPIGDNIHLSGIQNRSYQESDCGSISQEHELDLACQNSALVMNQQGGKNNSSIIAKPNKKNSLNSHDNNLTITSHREILDDDPKLMKSRSEGLKNFASNEYRRQTTKEYCDTIGTITWKNYIRLKRNVPLLLFQFLLPSIQVILFCICVGNDPFDIPVAIVNEESSADSFAALSSQFLQSLDTRLVRQVNYTNLDDAISSVRNGKNWGVIHIPENFTISIHKRFGGIEGEVDSVALENSTIKVHPDMTNQPIGHAMEVAFRRAYSELTRQTFEFLGLNPQLTDPPIRMESAIYSKVDMQNYLQYMSPGVLISISYIMATGLTSLAFIIERRDGLFDRTLAAGVDHFQMLISHSIVQLIVMVVQISLVVFFTFVIYKVPARGPFVWIFTLLLLQGLAGMSFGLMVSSICREENTAIMMILGTFYPNLLLAGVIWPIEAIPHWLRWFSYLQPQTLPTQSLRDLIVRGWDIQQQEVWLGFLVTSIWLVVFLVISVITSKLRK